jgi:hypothetical protein
VNYKKRQQVMKGFALMARDCDYRGDTVMRTQAANDWRRLATQSEADRAPKYLTWDGR